MASAESVVISKRRTRTSSNIYGQHGGEMCDGCVIKSFFYTYTRRGKPRLRIVSDTRRTRRPAVGFSNSKNKSACSFVFPIDCGVPNQEIRIVGGRPTGVNRYPWVAKLVYEGHFHCGGSLINSDYVLTAAHCVRK